MEGMTLFERLVRDITDKRAGRFQGTWGTSHLRKLKILYSGGDSMEGVEPTDKNVEQETLDDKLIHAVTCLTHPNGNKAPLNAWLAT